MRYVSLAYEIHKKKHHATPVTSLFRLCHYPDAKSDNAVQNMLSHALAKLIPLCFQEQQAHFTQALLYAS